MGAPTTKRGRWLVVALGAVIAIAAVCGWWWLRPPFESEYRDASWFTERLRYNVEGGVFAETFEHVSAFEAGDDAYTAYSRLEYLDSVLMNHNILLLKLEDSPAVQRDSQLRILVDDFGDAYGEMNDLIQQWEDQGFAEVAMVIRSCRPAPESSGCAEALASAQDLLSHPESGAFQEILELADSGADAAEFNGPMDAVRIEGEEKMAAYLEFAISLDEYVGSKWT